MQTTCREYVEKASHTVKITCAKNFSFFSFFFNLLRTTHCVNLSEREQTHLSAHSSNLCFIHAGFCYNISKWAPSKVLHYHKQFISHQVTKKTWKTHKIHSRFYFHTMSDTLTMKLESWKLGGPGRKLASCHATAQKRNWRSLGLSWVIHSWPTNVTWCFQLK